MKKTLATALAAALLAACGGSSSDSTPTLTSASAISTYLDGKTWVMTGDDLAPFPLGYNPNMNLGAATQCIKRTQLAISAGTWNVTTQLGTLNGAPAVLDVGTCDHTLQAGSDLAFPSTNVLVENVQGNGECFDVTITYTGFTQEGRGRFSADGRTMDLQLYFATQATGHRCADGAVGGAVTFKGTANYAFDSVQTYRLQ